MLRLPGKDTGCEVLLMRRRGYARFGHTPWVYVDHLVGVR